ncbi:hypothetical protein DRO53_01295 [Candidatus Bathyarchaeota archaeon]|nr:MAG: hypothetical protein DRO53_01295 [Candidatus Bathyarchaeota archaeon]
MKLNMRKTAIAFIVILIGIIVTLAFTAFTPQAYHKPSKQAETPILWTENLKEGLAKAEAQGKPVFLLFYSEGCRWCYVLEEDIYKNGELVEILNENFVCIRVCVDTAEGKNLARNFGVIGLPTIFLLKPDGSPIEKIEGYIPPEELLLKLRNLKV